MKHKEIMKELTQKREYIKQKVDSAKDDITSMKDLLKQLSDKHDEAKEMVLRVEQKNCRFFKN